MVVREFRLWKPLVINMVFRVQICNCAHFLSMVLLGGVRDVSHIHYPSWTDSIKPSLQFSCNFVVINASEGLLCFQIFFPFGIFVKCITLLFIFSFYNILHRFVIILAHFYRLYINVFSSIAHLPNHECVVYTSPVECEYVYN
jgi:hypothetical protein